MSFRKRLPGIYKVTCTANGRCYIGQSNDCPMRWAQHMADLFAGTHVNTQLQDDWSTHGHTAFSFTFLEREEDADFRVEREQFYIRAHLSQCYNVEWDRAHVIQNGVIVNRNTWQPLDPVGTPDSEPAPTEDIVTRWHRMVSGRR